MRALLLLILLFPAAHAQPADPCPLGTAEAVLEGADVRASLFPNGNLFFGGTTTNGDGYLTPTTGEDAGKSPLFAAGLWVSGLAGSEIRASGAGYATFAFRPGLAGDDGAPPTSAECAIADHIWIVSREDVAAFLRDGTLTDDLRDWPVHLGAPVLDGDGDSTNYDLAGGDQPAIRGDVMAFWAMTDTATDTPFGPLLGTDVAVEAYSFRSPPGQTIGTATVYRFTITNRAGVALDDVHAGLFLDPDLGNAVDNYIGTDTTRAMAFVYNADNDDDGPTGYGVPPAFGAVVLDSPPSDDGPPLGMTAATDAYFHSGPSTPPFPPFSVFYSLQGLWPDGAPMRARGNGYGEQGGAPITTFLFTGDPVTGAFWSERNIDGTGTAHPPGGRRMTLGSGPVTLAPDASASWTFALVFAQGSDHLDSVTRLRGNAEQMHALQAAGYFEPARIVGTSTPPPPAPPLAVRRPSPNPFAGTTALTLRGLAGEAVTLTVTDVLGRTVERRDVTPTADDVDVALGAGLAPGVYVVRVAGRGFDLGFPVVKTR